MVALAEAVSTSWHEIVAHCGKPKISRTTPQADHERAIAARETLDKVPLARAEIRTGARYVLKADVAGFYGTLYTHAIPWAFHSKPIAKANRSPRPTKGGGPPLFGNVIDHAFENIQSGQTIRIPIGPDPSFAIAEAVLCEVDDTVTRRLGVALQAFRFMDENEVACSTLSEAEKVRAVLQDALAEFELQLNPRKTRIVELPDALDTAWVHELASFALDSPRQDVQQGQLLRYMSRSFELVRQHRRSVSTGARWSML